MPVDTGQSTATVESASGTDLVADVGVLRLAEYCAAESDVLTGIDPDRAACVVVGLVASTTAGITQWCVDVVTAHLRTREQFGKVIGTFQALQHSAAMLLVNSELATAAAWDAVRAADESPDQHRLAAAGAATIAVSPVPDLVLDALTMLGAIGFTWEHDVHLYWRRAISLAGSIGPASRWARLLGQLGCTQQRDMSVNLGDAESDFRSWVAETLDAAMQLRNDKRAPHGDYEDQASGPQRTLIADAGLMAPHWPAPWGVDAGSPQTAHHRRGVHQASRAGPAVAEHRRMDPALGAGWRAKRVAGEPDPGDTTRRHPLVPAVQRAGSRLRPRVAGHPGDQGRWRLADQRPQDLDVVGAVRRPGRAAGAHRPRSQQAPRHRLFHPRYAIPRGRGPADQDGDRGGAFQRGLPQRCIRPRRHAAGRSYRRLEPGDRHHGRRAFGDQWIREIRPGRRTARPCGRTRTRTRRRRAGAGRTRRLRQCHPSARRAGNHPAARRPGIGPGVEHRQGGDERACCGARSRRRCDWRDGRPWSTTPNPRSCRPICICLPN